VRSSDFRSNAKAAFLSLLLILPAAVSANPFLGSASEAPAPAVRAPSGSGPAALVALQIAFRDRAADFLSAFKKDPKASTIAAVLAIAFLYGLLHAAGPGHRKTVVFSLFVSRRAKPWEPLAAGFLAAFVHAAAGVAVVLGLGLLRGAVASLEDTSRTGAYLEAGTFLVLVVLALLLAARKLAGILRRRGGDGETERKEGRLGLYGVVMVTSVVPCPGAVMMLLFALYLGLTAAGVAGVLAMSTGMGIVISAAGYLAYFGRVGLFSRLKGRQRTIEIAADLMELGSYLLMLAFSLFMVWPTLSGWLGR